MSSQEDIELHHWHHYFSVLSVEFVRGVVYVVDSNKTDIHISLSKTILIPSIFCNLKLQLSVVYNCHTGLSEKTQSVHISITVVTGV